MGYKDDEHWVGLGPRIAYPKGPCTQYLGPFTGVDGDLCGVYKDLKGDSF